LVGFVLFLAESCLGLTLFNLKIVWCLTKISPHTYKHELIFYSCHFDGVYLKLYVSDILVLKKNGFSMSKQQVLFCLIMGFNFLFVSNFYAQCTDGTQPECMCNSAEVLCTIDDLDGYTFSMDGFNHPEDAPDPMCPNCSGLCIPQNPTWFAFVAWCTDFNLEVIFTNCEAGTNFFLDGVQIALYASCGPDYDAIDCDVSSDDCFSNANKELNLSGLIIGDVYYFLVDGCASATCDIEIDVIGICGSPIIEDWSNGLIGEQVVCLEETQIYEVDDIDGANTFHWFIDGDEVAITDENFYDISWDEEGIYELCVDASNDPCIPIDGGVDPLCFEVTVLAPNAGTISASSMSLCPGEVSNLLIFDFNAGIEYGQQILFLDSGNTIMEAIQNNQADISTLDCETITVCSYNYATVSNSQASVGMNLDDLNCDNNCCELNCIEIVFEDQELPFFINVPENLILDCIDEVPAIFELEWNDNCDGMGMAIGVESGSADLCNGGIITRRWEYLDACNNLGEFEQTIEIRAPISPDYVSTLDDVNQPCSLDELLAVEIIVTNNGNGACQFEENIIPSITGDADECGGSYLLMWEYTDPCGTPVTQSQNIIIEASAMPEFLNLPENMTLSCNQQDIAESVLNYTNNDMNCLIEGSVSSSTQFSIDDCGGEILVTWEFTDYCGRTISNTQTITIEAPDPPRFLNMPMDITIACNDLLPTFQELEFDNGSINTCSISGSVVPEIDESNFVCGGQVLATWSYIDACNRNISYVQTISIEPGILEEEIFIPNIFSPNGDDKNDQFIIYSESDINNIQLLMIYDRWGGLVFEQKDFETNNAEFAWNGKLNGQNVDTGLYMYFIQYEQSDGNLRTVVSDVTVVR